MSLRSIPDSFSPEAVAAIDARLDAICAEQGVAIPLAIESGGRAWGFPSPDSDYDCRFVFVRPIEQHLSPWPQRDVIARHYLHLGERQRRVHFGDGKIVPQKKIFYALRPAATLRWLRRHPDLAVAPMHFPSLKRAATSFDIINRQSCAPSV